MRWWRDDKGELRFKFMSPFPIIAYGVTQIDRLRVVQTPWFGFYIHFHRNPDQQRDCHDHPWEFKTYVLRGWYTEVFVPFPYVAPEIQLTRTWTKGTTHRIYTNTAHRIKEVAPGTITLVVVGPKKRLWGFWVDGKWMDWKTYNRTYREARA